MYAVTDGPPAIDVVEVYEHANYEGGRQTLTVGRYGIDAVVQDGTLELPFAIFSGSSVDLVGDVEAVEPAWNDRAGSVEIRSMPPTHRFPENELNVIPAYLTDTNDLTGTASASMLSDFPNVRALLRACAISFGGTRTTLVVLEQEQRLVSGPCPSIVAVGGARASTTCRRSAADAVP